MFKKDKMPSARGQKRKKVHGGGTNSGFSLVELIVVIAILVVFAAILIPSLLQYTENSRAQKDESTMDEVVNAVQLALADQNCFDEMLQYSCTNNFVTYSDSTGDYASQVVDGEFWAPDGAGRATTITFNPEIGSNGDTLYYLSSAIVNDMTYGNGSVANDRTMEGQLVTNNQCYLKNASLNGEQTGYLYNAIRQTIGDSIVSTSQTYRNSSFTVFIKFTQKDGVTVADVHGQYNGTNLYEGAPSSIGSGTSEYDETTGAPIVSITTPGTTNSNISSSALQGGGNLGGDSDYKHETDGEVNKDGILSTSRLREIINSKNIKHVVITDKGLQEGIDVSEEQNGSIFALVEGNKCTVSTNQPNKRVKAPNSGHQWFNYYNCNTIDVSGLSVGHCTSLYDVFRHFGQKGTNVSITGLEYWDVSNVKNMELTFSQVGSDAETVSILGLSKWNTAKVETTESMFNLCAQSATTFTLSDLSAWNMSNNKNMYAMFRACGMMSTTMPIKVNLSKWNTSKVETMDSLFYQFYQSASDWSIGDLSRWNVSNVKDMDLIFWHTGLNADVWNVGNLRNWDTSNVISMAGAFKHIGLNSRIIDISYVENWDVSNVRSFSGMFSYIGSDGKGISHDGPCEYVSIGDLSKWNVSSAEDMSSMFDNFGFAAKEWDIGNLSNWDVSNVKYANKMFYHAGYWSESTNIGNLSNWDTSSLQTANQMFAGYNHAANNNKQNLINWNVDSVIEHEEFRYKSENGHAADWHITEPIWKN